MMEKFKVFLKKTFGVKIYGSPQSFIGWKITRDNSGIKISQRKYDERILSRLGLLNFHPVATPMGFNADFRSTKLHEVTLEEHLHHLYRSMLGGIA